MIRPFSAVSFAGRADGRPGRRRLLNLLSDRTTLLRGAVASGRIFNVPLQAPLCVLSVSKSVMLTRVPSRWIKHTSRRVSHSALPPAALVRSVTVGRRGTGRGDSPSSQVFRSDCILYERTDPVHFTYCFNYNRRPSKWKVNMFSS